MTGGATLTAESYDDTAIPGLFNIKYTKTIPKYWPFSSVSSFETTVTSPTVLLLTPVPASSNGGMPGYIPPLLGAILGLLGVITILCAVLFWLRRKKQQLKLLQSDSAASSVRKNRQTWSWLLGVYGDEKRGQSGGPTPSNPDPFDHSATEQGNTMGAAVETEGHQVYEMSG